METVGSHNTNSRLNKEAELLKAGWPTGIFVDGCNEERMLCLRYLEQKNIQVSKFLQSVKYYRLQMALKTPKRLLRNPEIFLKIITKSSLGKFSLRTQ